MFSPSSDQFTESFLAGLGASSRKLSSISGATHVCPVDDPIMFKMAAQAEVEAPRVTAFRRPSQRSSQIWDY